MEIPYDGCESDCAASCTSEDTPLDAPSCNQTDDIDFGLTDGQLIDKRRSSLCKECLEQDKDSGIEYSGEDSFILPDKELVTKIINQVEFYFSNENILKDPFLLKHVRRNKEGYVSLKLIATFRKVKTFTKDWRIVAYSLRQSTNLEVNELNTKVRRVDPLPNHDETTPSRTIILHNLTFEKVTMENVGDLVSKFGDVVLIRILRPGLAVPSDMKELKKFMTKHPEFAETVCAAVEFEKQQYASNALKELNSKKDWRGVRAIPLVEKSEKTSVSAPPSNAKQLKDVPAKKESIRNAPIKKRKNKKGSDASQKVPHGRRSEDHTSCSESEQFSPEIRRRSSGSVSSGYISSSPRFFGDYFERRNSSGSRQNTNATNSPATPRRASCMARPTRALSGLSESECSSPWVQRRLMAARENSSGNLHSRTLVPEGVLRLPYGPDGSNGFQKPRTVMVL